jgi:hypothetical protein
MNDDDIDVMLRGYAPRWRAAQPPAPTAETARRLATANPTSRGGPAATVWSAAVRRWSRQVLPVLATVAAIALIAGGMGLIRTPRHEAPGHTPTPSTSPGAVPWRALPETNPSITTTITSPSPDPGPASALPPCGSADLRVSSRSGVALGTRTIGVEFRSTGRPCQLDGFPVVTPLDAFGRTVAVPVEYETPEYGNPVAVAGSAFAVITLAWTSSWCAEEVDVAFLRLALTDNRGTVGVDGFGRSLCYGGPGSGTTAPIRVTEFRPEHFTPGTMGTPFDTVSVEAVLPATAKSAEVMRFRVILTARRDVVLDPCPDYSITIGHAGNSTSAAYGLNCADVPHRDAAGRPYLPAGTPVRFVMEATAPPAGGRAEKVTWQLQDTGAVGGGMVEVLTVR